MSAKAIIREAKELDANLYLDRAALFEAMAINHLPDDQRVTAIAHLIRGNIVRDVNRVGAGARLAAKIAALANGGRN